MTRAIFFKSLCAIFSFRQLGRLHFPPPDSQCFGVENGVAIEISCPDGLELCPLSHKQIPKKIYPVEHDIKTGDQFVAVEPLFHACSVCGVVYAPKAIDDTEKKEK